MAELRALPPTPCASDKKIQDVVLELLKYVRENRVYQLAFITITDHSEDSDSFQGFADIVDTGEYDLENMIDMTEALSDMVIDLADEIEDYEDY